MDDLWYGYEDNPYKKSPEKKKVKKSDHKHDYKPCLLDDGHWIVKGTYCVHCGRIYDFSIINYNNWATNTTLPRFKIDDIFKDKFVPLQDLK